MNLLIAILAMFGGYFAVATLYQLASGGNVSRMFGGSRIEVLLQVAGAIGALVLAMQLV